MDSLPAAGATKLNSAKKFIFSGIGVVTVVIIAVLGWVLLSRSGLPIFTSPYILQLTQPVYTFLGKVDRINGNTLSVSTQAYEISGKATQSPKIMTISYQVIVDSKTAIRRFDNPSAVTVNDIKVGEHINVTSAVDLRMIGKQFTATQINVMQLATNLNGVIKEVKPNLIVIKAIQPSEMLVSGNGPPVMTSAPVEKDYQVSFDSATQISRPGSVRLSQSDLKVGVQVTVYTKEDVASTTAIKATRIDVIDGSGAAPQSATGSGAINPNGPPVITSSTTPPSASPTAKPTTSKAAPTSQNGPKVITNP